MHIGLFDKFKKKEPSHDEKVSAAYKCYKAEYVSIIFPGGQTQASGIIRSIAIICNIDLSSCSSAMYYKILTVYADTLTRIVVTHSEETQIVLSLLMKHKDIVPDNSIAGKIIAYVMMNMKDNGFFIDDANELIMLDMLADSFERKKKDIAANAVVQNQYLNDPEYGLVEDKPIYVHGIEGSEMYISKLKSILGEPLTWNRYGSISMEGINGMIDIYDSTLPSGRPYKRIYINMYGAENSTQIPKGFSK